MSQWSVRHPEEMRNIAALPLSRQHEELADAQRRLPSQERAETLRNASRRAEQERQDHHDDMRKDAADDARAEYEGETE